MPAPEGNSYKKLTDGTFGVVIRGMEAKPGDTVMVKKKDGTTNNVTLAEFVEENQWHEKVFRIVSERKK